MKKIFCLLFMLSLTSLSFAKIATHEEQSIDYDLGFQVDQSDVEVRDIASDKDRAQIQENKIDSEKAKSDKPVLKHWKY